MDLFNDYYDLPDIPADKITGEWTPKTILLPDVPRLIAQSLPDMKVLVMLRNPVDRAYSHYLMDRALYSETATAENFHKRVVPELENLVMVFKEVSAKACNPIWPTFWTVAKRPGNNNNNNNI